MALRTAIKRRVASHLFGVERRNAKRRKAERRRQSTNAPHVVEYFHQACDPYSHLLAQVLPEFCRRYDVELRIHIVPPPPHWAAPDRERLESYSRQDALRLARRAGLQFSDPGAQPAPERLGAANAALVAAVEKGAFLHEAADIGHRLWAGERIDLAPDPARSVDDVLQQAGARRDRLGHYLGATLHYAGEWYWGLDRLHFLEARLDELGAAVSDKPGGVIFAPPETPSGQTHPSSGQRRELHWYLSFRSPYTAIVPDRVKALADAYGAELKLRFVLPMVMRGMQVPRKKGFYITSDAMREAERMNIPFGSIVDPVGAPVERGYAILHRAIELGRGFELAQSFLAGVFAEGIDAGTDRGLKTITERAGLPWAELRPLIGEDHWRAEAEANRDEMFSFGVWGVPSFRVEETATWGQDRLWVIEEALASGANATNPI